MQKNKKLKWLIPVAILLVLTVTFFVYINFYYHADPCVEASLITHDGVTVSKTDYGWYFDGASTGNALIFYCGAKVGGIHFGMVFFDRVEAENDVAADAVTVGNEQRDDTASVGSDYRFDITGL